MFKSLQLTISIMLLLIFTNVSKAQLSGTINVGVGQTYTSLTANTAAGFFNRVNTVGLNGNVTVLITSDITESGAVSLNQWTTGSAFTITIRPSAAGNRTLLANDTSGAFTFNGADNVVIDGRFSGSGRYLTFINSNTSGSTFRFINDARGNTITYCNVYGTNAEISEGVIEFTTTNTSNGNDNNIISNCIIRDYNGTTPQNAIYSSGSTTTTSTYNNGCTISNNEIYNFYKNGQVCSGVKLQGGTTDWIISGNSFYQTATRTATTATTYNVIYVNSSVANNITITGNYMGGSAASCGGSAWTFNGTVSNAIYFIRFASAGSTTASNVDGNFIQNFSFGSQPSTGSVVHFVGIMVESGLVNVGNTSGNTIGSSSSTGNITLSYSGTTSNIINRGIDNRRPGAFISNNTIGSVSVTGTNTSLIRFEAIYCSITSGTTDITNNTIGSQSTANCISALNSSMYIELAGIYVNSGNFTTVNATGNTIGNMTNSSTNNEAYLRGIFYAGNYVSCNVSNNTVRELLCSGTSTSRAPVQSPCVGIATNSSSANHTFSGNLIRGIRGNGNAGTYISGFAHSNPNSTGVFSRNKIYDITNSSTSGSPKVWAVNAYWGNWTYSNNQISVTNAEATDFIQNNPPVVNNRPYGSLYAVNKANQPAGQVMDVESYPEIISKEGSDNNSNGFQTDVTTNSVQMKGIHDEAQYNCFYYYNSVYVGGTQASGSDSSWTYDRPLSSWPTVVTMRNNIFYNARTGGTGKHYAIGNEIGSTDWDTNATNYNVFISANASTVGLWINTDRTIAQWRTSSMCDKHSWSTTTATIPVANLFTSVSTGNLDVVTSNAAAWIVSGKGIAVTGQNTDYAGNTRVTTISGGVTDIGADEFAATPPGNPVATVDNAPGSGVTSNYSLYGRVLMTVNWGTGGSAYPSALSVNYYSGINPPSAVSGNFSNSYWSVVPTGSLTGATFDVTINFGDNETYTITSPSANTRVAKYITSYWFVYITAGTSNTQTELNYANTWAKTRGVNGFTNFALTDASSPLPVEICSFDAAVLKRDVQLAWSTCSEVNNAGFDVERRAFNSKTGEYSAWVKAGYVEGNGTTNQQQFYKYNDMKLSAGKYQYRLKQIDYNGNFEYHGLNSPSELMIGTPTQADLFQNYPNPSNPNTKVDFQIPFAGKVSLKVYDLTGKEVVSLVDAEMESGYYTADFNGAGLASGVYFYRLIATSSAGNSFNKTMKMILVK